MAEKEADEYWADDRTLRDSVAERFCLAIVTPGVNSPTEALRMARSKDKTYTPQAASVKRMMDRPEVARRIKTLQEQAACKVVEAVGATEAFVIGGFIDVFERCMQSTPVLNRQGEETGEFQFHPAGANTALTKLGEFLGLFKDRKKQDTIGEQSFEDLERSIRSLEAKARGSAPLRSEPEGEIEEEVRQLQPLPETDRVSQSWTN